MSGFYLDPFSGMGTGKTFQQLQHDLQMGALMQADRCHEVLKDLAERQFQRDYGGVDKFNMRSLMNYAASKQSSQFEVSYPEKKEEDNEQSEPKIPEPIITEPY